MHKELSNKNYWILSLIILHFFHYLDYVDYNPTIGGIIANIIVLFLILFIIRSNFDKSTATSYKYILSFMLVPMLSIIPCYFDRGQAFDASIRAFMPSGIWLLYFYLQNKKFNVDKIVKILLIIAFVRIAITFVEQYTYPHYLFANRTDLVLENGTMKEVEIRSGFRRFLISDTFFSMFAIFYYYQKLLESNSHKIRILLLLFIAFFGLYMDQSRQFMASTLGSIAILTMFNSKYGTSSKLLFIFLLLSLYIGYDYLFLDLFEKTNNELNEDNIRIASYGFYLFEYWKGPITLIFGNGIPHYSSEYGMEISKIEEVFHFFRTDIGIVGALSIGGICTVYVFFQYYFKIIYKNWCFIEMYQKLFLISAILNLPLIFPITQATFYKCFWAIFIFILDMTISKNKTFHK